MRGHSTGEIRRQQRERVLDHWAPRTRYADWYPRPVALATGLVAVTVFTEYVVRNAAGRAIAATCVCGRGWMDENRQIMRKAISEHRCSDDLGHPAGLLPDERNVPDEPDDDVLVRVLAGLRARL